jgi:hypothetical protein
MVLQVIPIPEQPVFKAQSRHRRMRNKIIAVTTLILLISTSICGITGIIKWPGLIPALGLSFRDLPMALITDIHDWSGIIMMLTTIIHLVYFRRRLIRMVHLIQRGTP